MEDKSKLIQETIADIAYIAGQYEYYSGDSRADMSEFVSLAEKFEKHHKDVDWEDTDLDYIVEVEEFAIEKLGLTKRKEQPKQDSLFDSELSLCAFSLKDNDLKHLKDVIDIELREIFIDIETNNVEWTSDSGRKNAYGVYFQYSEEAIEKKETVPSMWVADFKSEIQAKSFVNLLKSFIILSSINKQHIHGK